MTIGEREPAAPKGTGPAGRTLWRDVVGTYVLDAAELAVLREAARTADLLDDLHATIAATGATLTDGRTNPAVIEARLQRLALARLIASLRLPDDDDARPQRRGGARGIYSVRRYGSANPPPNTMLPGA